MRGRGIVRMRWLNWIVLDHLLMTMAQLSRRRRCFDRLNWVGPLHSRLAFRRGPKNATKQTSQNVACQGSSQFNWFLRVKRFWGVIGFFWDTVKRSYVVYKHMADKLCTTHDNKLAPDLSLELNTNNAYYSKRKQPVIWFMFTYLVTLHMYYWNGLSKRPSKSHFKTYQLQTNYPRLLHSSLWLYFCAIILSKNYQTSYYWTINLEKVLYI